MQSRNPGWTSDVPLHPAGSDGGDPLHPATPDSRSPRPGLRSSLVYFSSVSENTHRFVQKLGLPATRIPLHGRIEVDQPYVLVLPTYGGGRATPDLNAGGYVP